MSHTAPSPTTQYQHLFFRFLSFNRIETLFHCFQCKFPPLLILLEPLLVVFPLSEKRVDYIINGDGTLPVQLEENKVRRLSNLLKKYVIFRLK